MRWQQHKVRCMSDVEEAEVAPAPAPEAAPEPTVVAFSGPPYPHALSSAQLSEVWSKASDPDAAIKLVARCLLLPDDFAEDARTAIWVDMVYKWVDFCRCEELSTARALAYVRLMAKVHAHAVESACSKVDALAVFVDGMLAETKALPLRERFSRPEVEALTAHAQSSYLDSIKLHQLVFTQEQTERPSHVELFLQTPAEPPPTSAAVDPDSIVPPDAPDAAAAPAPAPAAPAPAAAAPEPAPAPAAEEEEEPTLADAEMAEALKAVISSQVAALHKGMAAEYAQQEQLMLDRIAALETKVA